jgi:hypothetical protein
MKAAGLFLKFIFLVGILLLKGTITPAQVTRNDCGTPLPATPQLIDQARLAQLKPHYTGPLLMQTFVHIIADNDGSNLAAPPQDVMRQMINMKNFFAAHNICFILGGMEQINNTDLNNMNTDSEAAELNPYLVPKCLNIFVHYRLFDSTGNLNGNAYKIPNTFLSIVGSAVKDAVNISTLAHEMGHDFGLYHTFATWPNSMGVDTRAENVPRAGTCSNCANNGDLLCDTEADRDEGVDASCAYTGNRTDSCGNQFAPNTRNIMTYGNRACRNVFTPGQGQRSLATIILNNSHYSCIAPDDVSVSSGLHTSGRQLVLARNTVTIDNPGYLVIATAKLNITSSKVIIRGNARFIPGGDGYTKIRTNSLCQ